MAKTKSKNCYKQGDIDRARIYAETAVLKRKQSQHYQMLNARLTPILSQLKEEFSNGSGGRDKTKELRNLLQEISTLGATENEFQVSQNEINAFIEQINHDEQSMEMTYASPAAANHVADIEQRLANLRRKSPSPE